MHGNNASLEGWSIFLPTVTRPSEVYGGWAGFGHVDNVMKNDNCFNSNNYHTANNEKWAAGVKIMPITRVCVLRF